MKHKLNVVTCALCILCIISNVQAQELVSSAGGYGTNTNTTLGWTIGQIVTKTVSNSDYSLTQGFHQGSITVTGINYPESNIFQISVFPNPTRSQLVIYSVNPQLRYSNCTFLIYDMQGKMVLRQNGTLDRTNIDMMDYLPSVYLLKVINHDMEIQQSFHIVKQ
jgi:hypothetical protein